MDLIDISKLQGWHDDQDEVAAVAAQQAYPLIAGALGATGQPGIGKGKRALLYEYLYKARGGTTPDAYNYRVQAIGDCVSFGMARALDILLAILCHEGQATWEQEFATEPIYALGRVEIGKGRLGNQDGCVGAWAAEAVKKYGTLLRKKYGNHDFTTYSGAKAKELGSPRKGLPDELEPEARLKPVGMISLVTTWEGRGDGVGSGYPETIASNCGFSQRRDAQGFLQRSGSWNHQMCVIATDDTGSRPGACIAQSWPRGWVSGPTRLNMPLDAFWADADVVEKYILRQQDSWAVSNLNGLAPNTPLLGDDLFN